LPDRTGEAEDFAYFAQHHYQAGYTLVEVFLSLIAWTREQCYSLAESVPRVRGINGEIQSVRAGLSSG
jgi:hypothetical protein